MTSLYLTHVTVTKNVVHTSCNLFHCTYDSKETMRLKVTKINNQTEDDNNTSLYPNPYSGPIQIFNIQTFNARILKSIVVPTKIVEGHLSGDQLFEPKSFLLSNSHSNTIFMTSVKSGT